MKILKIRTAFLKVLIKMCKLKTQLGTVPIQLNEVLIILGKKISGGGFGSA
jgi:hypothetical protein